jgi:hypothetical protein
MELLKCILWPEVDAAGRSTGQGAQPHRSGVISRARFKKIGVHVSMNTQNNPIYNRENVNFIHIT